MPRCPKQLYLHDAGKDFILEDNVPPCGLAKNQRQANGAKDDLSEVQARTLWAVYLSSKMMSLLAS